MGETRRPRDAAGGSAEMQAVTRLHPCPQRVERMRWMVSLPSVAQLDLTAT